MYENNEPGLSNVQSALGELGGKKVNLEERRGVGEGKARVKGEVKEKYKNYLRKFKCRSTQVSKQDKLHWVEVYEVQGEPTPFMLVNQSSLSLQSG